MLNQLSSGRRGIKLGDGGQLYLDRNGRFTNAAALLPDLRALQTARGFVDSMRQQSDLDVDRLRLVNDLYLGCKLGGFSCCEFEILS